jgi:hypothetical protein
MSDNRPADHPTDRPDEDDDVTWEREESLFGTRSWTGELPDSPPPPGEVFGGRLFGRGGSRSDQAERTQGTSAASPISPTCAFAIATPPQVRPPEAAG